MPRPAARQLEITPQDIEQALTKLKLKLQTGDAVVLHTGWGKLWAMTTHARSLYLIDFVIDLDDFVI